MHLKTVTKSACDKKMFPIKVTDSCTSQELNESLIDLKQVV